ncbi:MAG: 3',5'-cyclic-AMP phosphodiesterase [Methylococcales bacterium]|nr:3',5'-cyclic-AMP phosphodiesterase [Methylococcales bacterium]
MKPLSLLQLTDLHIMPGLDDTFLGINTEVYFQAVLAQAFAEHGQFDLIIVTGDLTQEPCAASYQRIQQILNAFPTPSICLPGNHDDFGLMQQVLNAGQVSCRRQMVFEHWQLVCLNSQIPGAPGGRLAEQELMFLEECLRDLPDHKALVAVHHHCVPTQSAWLDTMLIENSPELLAMCAKYPQIKVITNGHIHQVMDVMQGDTRILGTPSTCFQFTPESASFSLDTSSPGYRWLNLYADGRVDTGVSRLPGSLSGLEMATRSY